MERLGRQLTVTTLNSSPSATPTGPSRWALRRRAPMYGPAIIVTLSLPFLALLSVGFVLPLSQSVINSLRPDPQGGGQFAELYRELLADDLFRTVLMRTFTTAAVVSLISLVLAYPTAEFIASSSSRTRPILLALVVLPLWSSVIARTYAWYGVFVRDGLVDRVADLLGFGPQQLLFSRLAVTLGMVQVMLPILILPVYAAVIRYDDRLSRASLSLGAGRLRTLLLIKLPMLAPSIVAATAAIFIITLGFFITPAILGGPRTQLVSNLIWQQVNQTFNLQRAQAMSVILLGTTLVLLLFFGGLLLLARRYLR